jgi:large subunit ribosomal protein L10
MSKYLKDLISKDIASKLDGVTDALLVNVVGLDANQTVTLRKQLREKGIQLMVIKNSMAARATEGTSLAPAFDGLEGAVAIVWGSEDIISLAKEVVALDGDKEYEAFKACGGVMDGEALTAERVKEVSKWPSRGEQLSILAGQILSPGADLAAALLGPGKALASQVKSKSEEESE